MLDRHKLMLKACEANSVSEEDYLVLGRAGLGTCLLADLPDWLIAYSAHLVFTASIYTDSYPNFHDGASLIIFFLLK